MTSCDDGYARYVFVNLANIGKVLTAKYDIYFYLLQSKVSSKLIEEMDKYAKTIDVKFYNIKIEENGSFDGITKYSKFRSGNSECFYSLVAHLYLPEEVDKVMYIDTGDVILLTDEYDFYYDGWKGRTLFALNTWRMRVEKDNFKDLTERKTGGFNSGQFILDIKQLRERNVKMQDYIDYANQWKKAMPKEKHLYVGDQAFLTGFFAGDIYRISKKSKDFDAYNVKVAKDVGEEAVTHYKSAHFNKMFENLKPWDFPFKKEKDLDKFSVKIADHPKRQAILSPTEKFYLLKWWEFCEMTPVYETLKRESFYHLKLLHRLVKFSEK